MEQTGNLQAQQARNLINENQKNKNFIIIDCRTKAEYDKEHIKDAQLLDLYDPNFINKLKTLDKTKKYLIYCRTGGRSKYALGIMKQLGFEKTYHLEGGILAWKHYNFKTIGKS